MKTGSRLYYFWAGAQAICCLAFAPHCLADSNTPTWIVESGKIEGLSWSAQKTDQATGEMGEAEIISPDHGKTFLARLRGRYEYEEGSLITHSNILVNSGSKRRAFAVSVPLAGQRNELELVAIDPHGIAQKETVCVVINDWPGFLNSRHAEKKRPLTVGLGFSSIALTQTGHADFSEDALTVKAEYRFLLFPPYWDLSVGSFFTATPLSTNQSGTDARFLGVNLRLGYRLPFIHEPWEFFIFGGAYYTTMFVTNNAFGYRNELGPQLFPTVRRFFKNGDGISVYVKYSPVTSGFSALTSSNREFAAGGAWLWRLRNQHLVSFSLDYANVNLDFPTLSSSVQVNTVNFGVGYNL